MKGLVLVEFHLSHFFQKRLACEFFEVTDLSKIWGSHRNFLISNLFTQETLRYKPKIDKIQLTEKNVFIK